MPKAPAGKGERAGLFDAEVEFAGAAAFVEAVFVDVADLEVAEEELAFPVPARLETRLVTDAGVIEVEPVEAFALEVVADLLAGVFAALAAAS